MSCARQKGPTGGDEQDGWLEVVPPTQAKGRRRTLKAGSTCAVGPTMVLVVYECYRSRRNERPSKNGLRLQGRIKVKVTVWHPQSQPNPSCWLLRLSLLYMGVGRLCLESREESRTTTKHEACMGAGGKTESRRHTTTVSKFLPLTAAGPSGRVSKKRARDKIKCSAVSCFGVEALTILLFWSFSSSVAACLLILPRTLT